MDEKARYLALALLFSLIIFLVFWDFLFWSGRYPPNCYIEKIDVSSLSKHEALAKLRSADINSASLSPIILFLDGKKLVYEPSEIGAYISPRRTVFGSDSFSYRSNYLIDLIRRVLGNYSKQSVPLAMALDRDICGAVLEGHASKYNIPSRDATFQLFENGTYKITKEKPGRKIDMGVSMDNIERAFSCNERYATLEVVSLSPRVYAKPLVKYPPKHLLAEYATYYGSHDSPNRVHNIKVATNRLNHYILSSGEVFSLLDNLGEFNRQRGFKEAFVLYNGELEPQYGGGSCQIASTVYNAAMLAGLEIVERHNHGVYFTIYPLGRDASIYSETRDLKIRNNTFHPVYMKGVATEKKLTFFVYGTPTGRKASFSRPMIFFDGEPLKTYNVMSDEAKEKINEALLSGKPFTTRVKVILEEGGIVKEKFIRSRYKLTGDRENVRIVRPEPE